MTARIGAMSGEGTIISDTDRARIEAEDQLHAKEQSGAVRIVAASSLDVEDCRMLLSMLGLGPEAVAAARAQLAAPPKGGRKGRAAA